MLYYDGALQKVRNVHREHRGAILDRDRSAGLAMRRASWPTHQLNMLRSGLVPPVEDIMSPGAPSVPGAIVFESNRERLGGES